MKKLPQGWCWMFLGLLLWSRCLKFKLNRQSNVPVLAAVVLSWDFDGYWAMRYPLCHSVVLGNLGNNALK
jgi:hypothetical protein